MQKPIDTTQRINQLLLRASKYLNTLGERERESMEGGGHTLYGVGGSQMKRTERERGGCKGRVER